MELEHLKRPLPGPEGHLVDRLPAQDPEQLKRQTRAAVGFTDALQATLRPVTPAALDLLARVGRDVLERLALDRRALLDRFTREDRERLEACLRLPVPDRAAEHWTLLAALQAQARDPAPPIIINVFIGGEKGDGE